MIVWVAEVENSLFRSLDQKGIPAVLLFLLQKRNFVQVAEGMSGEQCPKYVGDKDPPTC